MMTTQWEFQKRVRSTRSSRHRCAAAALVAASLSWGLPDTLQAAANEPSARLALPAGVIDGEKTSYLGTELRAFRGVPYAAAPVGELRWKPPQPVTAWAGVRSAAQFGARCKQLPLFPVEFRSEQMSEDCLFLNVWTPARTPAEKLPVLVYFHGGGFAAGDSSEPRFDGAPLASRGIVMVTVNYRLGVFGFLALPEMARESTHGAAGNYGLLDQQAALRWVRENIAKFGGDPDKVTIGGDSAGAIAVSAHMASPLSRGLFIRAIGQSGAAFGPLALWSRQDATVASESFQQKMNAPSLSELRAVPAQTLLAATGSKENPEFLFWPSVDGHFLARSLEPTYEAGSQAHVPLLVGNNTHEAPYTMMLEAQPPTPENWRAALKRLYGPYADTLLALYPGNDEDEVRGSATSLAGDIFVNHATRRWVDAHRQTGGSPVYFYRFAHQRPPQQGQPPEEGAVHSSEIRYALGTLRIGNDSVPMLKDQLVSSVFSGYIAQFVKTGTPDEGSSTTWPAAEEQLGGLLRKEIGGTNRLIIDREAPRHTFLRRYFDKKPPALDQCPPMSGRAIATFTSRYGRSRSSAAHDR